MAKLYKSPPLLEAICEFQFDPAEPWDATVSGRLYDKICDQFPNKEQRKVYMQTITMQPTGPTAPGFSSIDRMQFYNRERNVLVQTNPHFLSINHLRPYTDWATFSEAIETAFRTCCEISTSRKLLRTGLRYINRIVFPTPSIKFGDYFTFYPEIRGNVEVMDFIVGTTIPKPDANNAIRLQLSSTPPDAPGTAAMLLDIDRFTVNALPLEPDAIMGWVSSAHNDVETFFESCITDRTREIFNG